MVSSTELAGEGRARTRLGKGCSGAGGAGAVDRVVGRRCGRLAGRAVAPGSASDMPSRLANQRISRPIGVHSDHASRARPVRQLRAHAARDGRAVRRRLRPAAWRRASAAASRPRSTSTTRATRRARSSTPISRASTPTRSRSRSRAASSCSPATAGPADAEDRVYQQLEIEHGPFRRVVALGADVDADAARATYRDGILSVELPLVAPESRTRRCRSRSPRRDVRRAR